ncbi:hypothetical protein N665_0117s0032 [Sinapis alba]|nr:hypothetical protein N665_0117s0032 [Sinapis alba]
MRNGDYSPSRLQAQTEAVNLLCGAKTQSNPENTVGILTMAGKGVRVLTTLTLDLGKILACMQDKFAQLALKHCQNKNQRQRIIVFAGFTFLPIKYEKKAYEKKALEVVGKRLKKNSVSRDTVNFGDDDDEEKPQKLEALLAAVNNNDGSHIVHVPSGANVLSDVLLSTSSCGHSDPPLNTNSCTANVNADGQAVPDNVPYQGPATDCVLEKHELAEEEAPSAKKS